MGKVSFIPAGRLGNYFFTCAAAWAYAKRHGMEFSAPTRTSNEFWSPIYMPHLQDLNYDNSIPTITVREKHFHYAPIDFQEEWRNNNITLSGYFQSEKYWKEYKEEMLDAFKLDWHLNKDICSLHGRFGDYLTIGGKHILLTKEFILDAIEIIKEKTGITRFKVFSDDLNYFRNQFGNLYPFEYSTNETIWEDFIEMSCCHSHINSSSTFSWWSAYVNRNPDKVIVTSRNWFQPNWDNADTSDIVPSDWIKI